MAKVTLKKLNLGVKGQIFGDNKVLVSDITSDSRKVKMGHLFVAVKGLSSDGHDYIDSAIKSGASVVVGEKKPSKKWLNAVVYIQVKDSRVALGEIASKFYGNPSSNLKVIGVTGTDGKTTTANIIYHILNSVGNKTGLVSTISAKIGNKEIDTGFHVTNPGAVELQKFLSEMVKDKCKFAVVEVTSHGIDQGRVSGVNFDAAVLTNISNEHLDYHTTFENYQMTKAKLFAKDLKVAVLNKDDKSFERISKFVDKKTKLISYSMIDSADYEARDINMTSAGIEFKLNGKGLSFTMHASLIGDFNVSNTLAAVSVCSSFKLPLNKIVKAVSSFKTPKGRIQEVKNNRGIKIIIDYAHTPNAVINILKAFRKAKGKGKLISLVSAEGERDPGKRRDIPKASVKFADVTILNPIDPRSEDPKKILSEMEKGAMKAIRGKVTKHGGHQYSSTVHGIERMFASFIDRQEAIDFAINKAAKKGDTVLILGKGHETGMDCGDREEPWSDLDAVTRALGERSK